MKFNIDDNDINKIKLSKTNKDMFLPQVGMPICYDKNTKRFTHYTGGDNLIYIGVVLNSEFKGEDCLVNVLYKGFLLKDVLKMSRDIKEYNVQNFVKSTFKQYKNVFTMKMPYIKKLKRINIKMLDNKLTNILYNNFDKIINGYKESFGEDYAEIIKAQIVTMPFYVKDKNEKVWLYKFEDNTINKPTLEDTGNFLCYFTYQYKF